MKRILSISASALVVFSLISACTNLHKTTLFAIELPYSFNSPASFALLSDNNILFTSPNLHNDEFMKQGLMMKAEIAAIGLIDQQDKLSTWYRFKPQDMEPTSKTVVPMGIARGPDGNIYVADMQLWSGGESRILRIYVDDGKAISVDVVAKGLSFPNAVAWRGKDLFISDTVLKTEKGKYTVSGVYRININALNADSPVQIKAYKSTTDFDKHLFEAFKSNGSLGFGANGLAVDDKGNLYTGIMEEGAIYKTTFDNKGNKASTTLFNQGLIANDGIQWDAQSQALYTTDLFANAVYRINADGSSTLLTKNGDTNGKNGLIDAPGEVIMRGNKAYITNFDASFGVPNMLNTKPDAPITISVLSLGETDDYKP